MQLLHAHATKKTQRLLAVSKLSDASAAWVRDQFDEDVQEGMMLGPYDSEAGVAVVLKCDVGDLDELLGAVEAQAAEAEALAHLQEVADLCSKLAAAEAALKEKDSQLTKEQKQQVMEVMVVVMGSILNSRRPGPHPLTPLRCEAPRHTPHS